MTQLAPNPNLIQSVMEYSNPLFIARYGKTKSLSEEIALKHFTELKKFLIVCFENDGQGRITPSRKLDEVWHDFILFTKDYQEFCIKYFGKMIHHKPSLMDSKEKEIIMNNGYLRSLSIAKMIFKNDLDKDLCPNEPENSVADSGVSSFVCEDYGGNC
jgi:hypothetical protein